MLYTKQIMPIRARKDIVCYKYVVENTNGSYSTYQTPLMNMPIDIGKTYDACGNLCKNKYVCFPTKIEDFNLGTIYEVAGGYIHCFTSECKERLIYECGKEKIKSHIIECIIPKGTLYYKDFKKIQIAAKQIRTIKLIV